MTITPEQAEVIEEAIESKLLDVHTSLPGVVQSYNSTTQTADIELQIRRTLEDENGELTFEDLPVLQNVRVRFSRSSTYFVAFPLVPGDTGDVFFSEAPTGQWRAVSGVAYPDDVGRHTLSGAVFYPGNSKDSDPLTDSLTEGLKAGVIGGAHVLIKTDGTVKAANAAGDFQIKASGQFDANGNFTVDP
jgi:hypothetical protein